jgi:hypothetical protein
VHAGLSAVNKWRAVRNNAFTTGVGGLLIGVAVLSYLTAMFDGDPTTTADMAKLVETSLYILAGVGLIGSRNAWSTSEDSKK